VVADDPADLPVAVAIKPSKRSYRSDQPIEVA